MNSSKTQNQRKFLASSLFFEENSTVFTKYMTSILQFIKEFEIEDVKIKIFLIKK
jgi:hypothetical protein